MEIRAARLNAEFAEAQRAAEKVFTKCSLWSSAPPRTLRLATPELPNCKTVRTSCIAYEQTKWQLIPSTAR